MLKMQWHLFHMWEISFELSGNLYRCYVLDIKKVNIWMIYFKIYKKNAAKIIWEFFVNIYLANGINSFYSPLGKFWNNWYNLLQFIISADASRFNDFYIKAIILYRKFPEKMRVSNFILEISHTRTSFVFRKNC